MAFVYTTSGGFFVHPHVSIGAAYINLGVHLATKGQLDNAVEVWKAGLQRWQERPILGDDPVVLALNAALGLKNLGEAKKI